MIRTTQLVQIQRRIHEIVKDFLSSGSTAHTVRGHRIFTVSQRLHDEITGDIPKDEKTRERLREVLRIQEIPCRVPISWNDEYGANWRACSGK